LGDLACGQQKFAHAERGGRGAVVVVLGRAATRLAEADEPRARLQRDTGEKRPGAAHRADVRRARSEQALVQPEGKAVGDAGRGGGLAERVELGLQQ
jgi:hypothetical protein